MPFLLISILNIISFGSYIFCVFLTILWILFVILFNKLKIFGILSKKKKREPNQKPGFLPGLQLISETAHLLVVFILFINYFANKQGQF